MRKLPQKLLIQVAGRSHVSNGFGPLLITDFNQLAMLRWNERLKWQPHSVESLKFIGIIRRNGKTTALGFENCAFIFTRQADPPSCPDAFVAIGHHIAG